MNAETEGAECDHDDPHAQDFDARMRAALRLDPAPTESSPISATFPRR